MNPLIAEIPSSLIRSIAARKRAGDIDLGLGEPTLPPDIVPFEAALEWTRRNGSPYTPNAGLPELRELIAEYLTASRGAALRPFTPRGDSGLPGDLPPAGDRSGQAGSVARDAGAAPASPDAGSTPDLGAVISAAETAGGTVGDITAANVCVTIGSEEALYLAIKTVVNPARDEVLIVEPCYLAYPKICMLEGIRHRMVALSPAERFRPSAATVLEQVRPDTRLIIINSPCNPTGRVWPAEELRLLAEGLAVRGGETFVLTDEVYRELYYGETPPASIADFHPGTVVAGSLSKSCSLTGLRIGWLAGPVEVISAATKVHQFVNTAASTFAQRVAVELFTRPGSLSRNRAAYADARDLLLAVADRAGIDLIPPEGAFYALLRLPPPHGDDSLSFAERLIEEERVVSVPGRAFGESGEGWLRISWVAPTDALEEGLVRIARAIGG